MQPSTAAAAGARAARRAPTAGGPLAAALLAALLLCACAAVGGAADDVPRPGCSSDSCVNVGLTLSVKPTLYVGGAADAGGGDHQSVVLRRLEALERTLAALTAALIVQDGGALGSQSPPGVEALPPNGCTPAAPFFVPATSACVAACPTAADGTPTYADAGYVCRARCPLATPYNTTGGCVTLATASKLALRSPAVGAPLIAGRNVTFDAGCAVGGEDACRSTFVFDLLPASGAASVRLSSFSPGMQYNDNLGGCYAGCRWGVTHTAAVPDALASGDYTLRATRTIEWCPGSAG